MNVIHDPGAGDSAEVPAEVVALRPVGLGEGGEPALREPVDLQRLLVRKVAELTHVPVGGDHQVARGVRKLVQEHECVLSPGDDQPLLVAGGGRTAEDAFGLLVGLGDVFQPPRRPQLLRHAAEPTRRKPDGVTSAT